MLLSTSYVNLYFLIFQIMFEATLYSIMQQNFMLLEKSLKTKVTSIYIKTYQGYLVAVLPWSGL